MLTYFVKGYIDATQFLQYCIDKNNFEFQKYTYVCWFLILSIIGEFIFLLIKYVYLLTYLIRLNMLIYEID